MQVQGFGAIFFLGCFGGVVVEILRWWRIRESGSYPAYAKRSGYWLITGLMIVTGGILSVLYGTTQRDALLPVNIGASAPAIIAAFVTEPRKRSQRSQAERYLNESVEVPPSKNKIRSFLSFQA